MKKNKNFVIVFDGKGFHVRRLVQSVHDFGMNEMKYTCDKPIANDLPTLDAAVQAAESWVLGKKRSKKARVFHTMAEVDQAFFPEHAFPKNDEDERVKKKKA